MIIYIDIETVPPIRELPKSIAEEMLEKKITVPGNYSKPESIKKWEEEKKPVEVAKKMSEMGLNGTFGEVWCVGVGIDDKPVQIISRAYKTEDEPMTEKNILNALDAHLDVEVGKRKDGFASKEVIWVGHYLSEFDLRFLWQRMVMNGVKPSIRIPYDAKPWSQEIYDTCLEWKGRGNASSSLDVLCMAMGHPGKDGMDGSKVWQAVQDKEYEKVNEYCKEDVERVRYLYKRMTFS